MVCLTALATACGGQPAAQDDSDTDDLSSATVSMEMVRQNPSLAPSVTVPKDVRVNGRARPVASDDVRQKGGIGGQGSLKMVGPSNWLYNAHQLGQFLNLADPAIHHDDKGDATFSRQPGDLLPDDARLDWLDVEQGHLGDCNFAASLAAVLYADNGGALTKSMIVPRTRSGKDTPRTLVALAGLPEQAAVQTLRGSPGGCNATRVYRGGGLRGGGLREGTGGQQPERAASCSGFRARR